jgi:hypothetical protein
MLEVNSFSSGSSGNCHFYRRHILRMSFSLGLRRREAYLAEAQRPSHTGSFGWNISTAEISWSDETFRLFEFAPSSKVSLPMILERVRGP